MWPSPTTSPTPAKTADSPNKPSPTPPASTSPNSDATKPEPATTLDVVRRIATTLTTSIDSLANDDNHLPQDLRRHFEAINQLDPDEQTVIKTLIEATLIRHQARKITA